MSVSFTAEKSDITGFSFTCGHDNGRTEHRFGSYVDAESFLIAEIEAHGNSGHLAVCGDEYCKHQRMFIQTIESDPAPVVNVSTTNAKHLLGLLGLDSDECVGGMKGDDFMGRVLMAQAVNPADAGVPATELEGPGPTLINCGRSEGYSEERLAELHELAQFSISTGREIFWS